MNNKLKRSIAVVLTAAAICNSLGTTTGFSKININSVVASAAYVDPQTSGTTNKYFYSHADGYSLYFSVTSSSAKTATLTGCTTSKDIVNITIPRTVNYNGVNYTITTIGENAFRNQTRIRTVSGIDYVTEIGSYAFAGCENLEHAYTGKQLFVKTIRYGAFMDCYKFASTDFLSKVKTIEDYAFKNCKQIHDLYANELSTIGAHAFENCDSITDVYAPELTTMGSYAFAYCYNLTNVDLKNSKIKTIPEYAFAFIGCSKTKTELIVNLPSTVQTIGNHAFYDAQRLEFINLSNVTNIGDMAFTYCWKLKTVLTSDNLTKIGGNAFNCCDSLKFFVCKNPNVSIGSGAFGYRQGSREIDIVLWGSNGGGNVKTYAANNGLTYKNTEDAPKEAIKKFEPYVWTCGNTPTIFGVKNEETQDVVRFFTDKHKAYVDDRLEKDDASGSCYGMAAISSLVYNGYLNVGKFATKKSGEKYSSISAIDRNLSDFTRSFINSVWANYRNTYDYKLFGEGGKSEFDVNGKDAEMFKYMEYITYGADVAAVGYTYLGINHAIVCLGMEFYDNASDKSNARWKNGTMDARILLYDVNKNKFSNNYCMYVDFETGKWTMDYDYQTTLSSDKYKNFEFELYYKPDSIISNGSLKGLSLLTKLIRAK